MISLDWNLLADAVEQATMSEYVKGCPDGCCGTDFSYVDGYKLAEIFRGFAKGEAALV